MSETRNIDFRIDPVTQTQIAEVTGNREFYNAIGYLSAWNMTFPHVTITARYVRHDDPELLAIYRREESGPTGYAIAAVWHDDHFGFHS